MNDCLVAVDWKAEGLDIAPVLAFLGDAVIDHVETLQPYAGTKTGPEQPVHRVTFDRSKVRPAHAHGVGYRAGFLVHLERV